MNRVIPLTAVILFLSSPSMAEEYAIIRDSLFGTQKIEIFQTQGEALRHYSGEGKVYRIIRQEIPVKRVETRKKVEVTEYGWVIDDRRPRPPVKAQATKPAKKPEK